MDKEQMLEIENLTTKLNFDLAILNSAVKDTDNFEVCVLNDFVEKIYQDSEKVRDIFNNERCVSHY